MARSLCALRRYILDMRRPEAQLALFPKEAGEASFKIQAFLLHGLQSDSSRCAVVVAERVVASIPLPDGQAG